MFDPHRPFSSCSPRVPRPSASLVLVAALGLLGPAACEGSPRGLGGSLDAAKPTTLEHAPRELDQTSPEVAPKVTTRPSRSTGAVRSVEEHGLNPQPEPPGLPPLEDLQPPAEPLRPGGPQPIDPPSR